MTNSTLACLYFCRKFWFILMAWKPAEYCQPVTAGVEMTALHQQTWFNVMTLTWHTNNIKKNLSLPATEQKTKNKTLPRILDWSQLPHETEYWHRSELAPEAWPFQTCPCVCLFKCCLASKHTHQHKWKGGGERGAEQMAKNSPFPCGLDSKPVQSVGTPLGPVACGV